MRGISFTVSYELLLDINLSVGIDSVSQHQFGLYGGHIVMGGDYALSLSICFISERRQLQLWITPNAEPSL